LSSWPGIIEASETQYGKHAMVPFEETKKAAERKKKTRVDSTSILETSRMSQLPAPKFVSPENMQLIYAGNRI